MQHFNPIQSKWVVAAPMRRVCSLIATTINPIWCSRPVHPGTEHLQFVALKARKTSSLHTILF